jgi:hypothetical protein
VVPVAVVPVAVVLVEAVVSVPEGLFSFPAAVLGGLCVVAAGVVVFLFVLSINGMISLSIYCNDIIIIILNK